MKIRQIKTKTREFGSTHLKKPSIYGIKSRNRRNAPVNDLLSATFRRWEFILFDEFLYQDVYHDRFVCCFPKSKEYAIWITQHPVPGIGIRYIWRFHFDLDIDGFAR